MKDRLGVGSDAGTLRLCVVLQEGEIPRWAGEALLALDRCAAVAVQLKRSMARPAPPPLSPFARRWRARIPLLSAWSGVTDGEPCLARWEAASGEGCDAQLFFDAAPSPETVANAGASPRIWVLVDGMNRVLSPQFPVIDPVCRGAGMHLKLLQYQPASLSWTAVRSLHRASCTRYSEALRQLPDTVLRLVQQAAVDWALRQARTQFGRAEEELLAGHPAPLPPAVLSAWGLGLLGGLRCCLARWQESLVSEYWRIGVLDMPIGQVVQMAQLPPVRWLTPRRMSGYWADPFGLPGDAQRLACEFVDERSGKGHIEVLRVDSGLGVAERVRLDIGGGQHTSFPNVFELGGRRLGVAETGARRECVLYEVDAQGIWRQLFPLLRDIAAADPALFAWEGRLWLAFTDVDLGVQDNLCLYHAETLEGPWRPHANNPVKVDVTCARMAGAPFWHGGALYRPAQDCLRTYGAAVVVHRIWQLTPETFVEVPVRRLSPDAAGPCPHGLHTLSAWGERTLVDGKRHGLNPVVLARKIRQRLARFLAGGSAAPSGLRGEREGLEGGARRVLVYLPGLRVGGGEISMLRLAGGLVAEGFCVDLVVQTLSAQELPLPPGVSVVNLDRGGTLASLPALVRLLRERRPRWLLSAFPHTNIAAVAARLLSGADTLCVLTEHAPLSHQIPQQASWRFRVLPPLIRWAYRRAQAVVAVSSGVRDDLRRMLGNGVDPLVIHNPVLADDFADDMALPPDEPWLIDESVRVVLGVCRLSAEKDLPTLIRAFAEVYRERPATRLVLAGEGPDRARLESLVAELGLAEVVRLPGRIATPLSWMRRAAVFVLASRYEGFGNVLVEAMACGTPVVSTDCPVGPHEILDGGRLGTLVPVGDASAMARAIAGALVRGVPLPGAREAALRYTQAGACASYRQLLERLARAPC
ncbi:MAG: glycosyltransferase [Betaproteobacteria bacterium]|nr:glycosyltransferase [Betaproteobacteria bacterium]